MLVGPNLCPWRLVSLLSTDLMLTSTKESLNETIWVHSGCTGQLFASHAASGVYVVLVCIVFSLCGCIHDAQHVVWLSFHAGFLLLLFAACSQMSVYLVSVGRLFSTTGMC